ncbi:MAG: efflux RND transporter periplasmic adaptor subunit [Bacteroidetes bacterium]|nr:efflux RND transporter periplasmic adaptor subunit [Bacteroidota bacterium]
MKKVLRIILLLLVLAGFAYTLLYLYRKDQEKPIVYSTEEPAVKDIYKKTVATGSIVPRQEVEVKPRVSGVLTEIYVEPGAIVKKGDRLAKITIIPDVVSLNNAENRVKTAELTLSNSKTELERNSRMLEADIITEQEFERVELNYELAKEELETAKNNLDLVREGALKGAVNKSNNLVVATVSGMVLDVPVKVGASVIESNSFNPGTAIITLADMNDLIFEGTVDESEVGKIKEGMDLKIKVGAIDNERFAGKLEFIAPKGTLTDGTIQFQIKASVEQKEGIFIRAGYSANAEIILDERKDVLALNEGLILFEEGKAFVEVETGEQEFEKRELEIGLSDGIYVEVLKGLDKADKIKVQEAYGAR